MVQSPGIHRSRPEAAPFRAAQGPVLTGWFFIRSTRSWAWVGMSLDGEEKGA